MFFIGIDLAWSEKNSSGIAVIEGQKDTARFICGASDIQRDSDILDFEVFPHSAMVVIFKLKEILKYKPKRNRPYHLRWQEFETYQSCLKSLENRKPSLNLPHDIINTNVRALKGKALKQYEDLLDAIFCAYIAYYYWSNPGKCLVIGDLNDGYIVTPDPDQGWG
jgi:predicted RNase H-like nuclease